MTGTVSSLTFAQPVNILGLRFDRRQAEARACCVSFQTPVTNHPPEILSSAATSIHADVLRAWQTIERDASSQELRETVSAQLSRIAGELIQSIAASCVESSDQPLAVGLHGAGTWEWRSESESPTGYSELIPPSLIAEQTGLTVVDDFPGRDLALGGHGYPVEVHGLWMLLTDRSTGPGRSWRGLLDVSPTASRFTLVGPPDQSGREDSLFGCDICVGTRLFAELIGRSQTRRPTTDVDKLAASGRIIPELETLWVDTARIAVSRHPDGVSALPLIYALNNSDHADTTLPDQLATATRFLARKISDFAKHGVPANKPVGELFVMGDGSRNGLLLRHLNEWLTPTPIRRLNEIGHDRTIHAAAIAALTSMHLWQIPIPSTRQGAVHRITGRLTPGTPSNWSRVLSVMTDHAPWLLPLRDAI